VSRSREVPELTLVYALAGGAARREALRGAAREALRAADFDRLVRELVERRLLSLIGSRAVEVGADLVPDGFAAAVTGARAAARGRGLAVEGATRRVVSVLAAAGIRALPLKGPLLAEEAHGDIGLRETADVDLLVPRSDLVLAVGALRAIGFSEPDDPVRADGLPDLHFRLTHVSLPSIELHWRVHWDEREFSERLLARAAPGPDGLLRAAPDDLAASLLLFYARDGFHGVRMAADIAAWWDRHGRRLAPGFLEAHARSFPALAPSFTAAALAAERLTGTPALGWLGGAVSGGRRVSMAARLADWAGSRDRDQLTANISLVSALLGPPRSVPSFARRELSLPRAGLGANAAHAGKVTARFALALWAVRSGRAWVEAPVGVAAGMARGDGAPRVPPG
jgi:hypothetical protein